MKALALFLFVCLSITTYAQKNTPWTLKGDIGLGIEVPRVKFDVNGKMRVEWVGTDTALDVYGNTRFNHNVFVSGELYTKSIYSSTTTLLGSGGWKSGLVMPSGTAIQWADGTPAFSAWKASLGVVDNHLTFNTYNGPGPGGLLFSVNGATRLFTTYLPLKLNSLSNATSHTGFLVADSGIIKYRTAAQTLSDLGAAPVSGSSSYIQNQMSVPQNGKFWINGSSRLDSLLTVGNLSTDPLSSNGGIFYNSSQNTFRGYQNGSWKKFLMEGDAAPASGSGKYIQNQFGEKQTANAWVDTLKALKLIADSLLSYTYTAPPTWKSVANPDTAKGQPLIIRGSDTYNYNNSSWWDNRSKGGDIFLLPGKPWIYALDTILYPQPQYATKGLVSVGNSTEMANLVVNGSAILQGLQVTGPIDLTSTYLLLSSPTNNNFSFFSRGNLNNYISFSSQWRSNSLLIHNSNGRILIPNTGSLAIGDTSSVNQGTNSLYVKGTSKFTDFVTFASLPIDPTGSTNGSVFYSSNSSQFRGYRNGAWKNFLMEGDPIVTDTVTANAGLFGTTDKNYLRMYFDNATQTTLAPVGNVIAKLGVNGPVVFRDTTQRTGGSPFQFISNGENYSGSPVMTIKNVNTFSNWNSYSMIRFFAPNAPVGFGIGVSFARSLSTNNTGIWSFQYEASGSAIRNHFTIQGFGNSINHRLNLNGDAWHKNSLQIGDTTGKTTYIGTNKLYVNGTSLFENNVTANGNVQIGAMHDAIGYASRLDFGNYGNSDPVWFSRYNQGPDQTELRLNIGDDGGDRFTIGHHFYDDGLWKPAFSVTAGGQVSIGTMTIPGGYKLAVGGNVIAEKYTVQLQTSWPDYVFNKNYKLPSLKEVEAFIQQYDHLPDMPSAEEVKKEGLDLGSGQAVLLKKVEELTLYIIDQNKKIESLTKEVEQLKGKSK